MRRLLLPILVAATGVSAAHAAPVAFAPLAPDARERSLVTSVLGEVENAHSAVIDVDGDGTGEIAVKTDCPDVSAICRTVVLSHDGSAWRKVFDGNVGPIALAASEYGTFQDIRADIGRWAWNGVSYVFAADTGDAASFARAPDDYQTSLATQFGQGAVVLVEEGTAHVEIASVRPSEGVTTVLARLEGRGVCGLAYGCPIRMLSVEDGTYRELLAATGEGSVSLSPTVRGGWRDVVVQRPGGVVDVYGWTGEAYASAN